MRVHWQSSNDLVALRRSARVQELIQTVFKDKVLPSEQARRQPPRRPPDRRRRRRHLSCWGELVNIADHAVTAAQSPALIPRRRDLVGELYARSRRVAALLHEAGLRRGDGVALILSNRGNSSRSLGLPAFRLTTRCQYPLHSDEVAYVIDDCDAKAVFVDASMTDLAEHVVT